MNQKYKYIYLLFFFLAFILFAFRGYTLLDPDFGWHLKMGELILKQGIPRTDPFSYTMPSFHFVDHEWLTNIVIYWLNSKIGKTGLSMIFALLTTATLILNIRFPKINNLKGWEYFGKQFYPLVLLFLSIGTLYPFVGVRPQILSWFLLSILIKILTNLPKSQNLFYFLPFYFLFWANLHGSFAVGIVTLFMVISARTWSLKKILLREWVTLFLCVMVTLVNPYGSRLWGEVWMQISDTSLRWRIAEWMPVIFFLNFSYLVLLVLSGAMIIGFRKKFKPEVIILYLFFLVQGILSVRHIPLWLMICLPLVANYLKVFVGSLSKVKYGLRRFGQMTAVFFGLSIIILIGQIVLTSFHPYSEENYYPLKAVNYLKSNLPEQAIFSEYGWGGYLIWRIPEKKVFIDGRMPSWRWKENLNNESNNAMNDYLDLLSGKKPYKDVFRQYEIKTVLWSKSKNANNLEKLENKLSFYLKKLLNRQDKEAGFNLITNLSEDGWIKVYEDSVAVIYEAPKDN